MYVGLNELLFVVGGLPIHQYACGQEQHKRVVFDVL